MPHPVARFLVGVSIILAGPGARAQDQGNDPKWVGRKVVLKDNVALRLEAGSAIGDAHYPVYTVEQTDGEDFLLAFQGIRGWVAFDHIVSFEKAADYFTRELDRKPNSAWLHFARGCVRFEKQEYDPALEDFHAAIKLDPKSRMALLHRRRNGCGGTSATRPSPMGMRSFASIPRISGPTPSEALPGSRNGSRTGHSRTSMRPFASTPTTWSPTTSAGNAGPPRGRATRRSPISMRPFRSIRGGSIPS